MRKLFPSLQTLAIFSFSLFLCLIIHLPGAQAAIPTAGLVAHWSFDGVTGSVASDELASTSDAQLFNAPATTTGKIGDALSFDGTSQHAEVPLIDFGGSQAVSVSFWFKYAPGSNQNGGGAIIEFSPNQNNTVGSFAIFGDDAADCGGSGALLLTMRGDVSYNAGCYDGPISLLNTDAWHHYVAVFDKSLPGDEVNLFVDGVLQAPTDRVINYDNGNNFDADALYMMARGGSSVFQTGSIDDIRLYSRALTAQEAADIYTAGTVLPPPQPASLTVITDVINDDGGTATSSDFTITASATNVSSSTFPGSATGSTITFDAGNYDVSGSVSSLYILATSSACSGALAAGAGASCTFTYDDIAQATSTATTTPIATSTAPETTPIPPQAPFAIVPSNFSRSPGSIPLATLPEQSSIPEACELSGSSLRFGSSGPTVAKLQQLLNKTENIGLEISGVFDKATLDAVKNFQNRYASEILAPWGVTQASGAVSFTTMKQINKLGCGTDVPFTAEQLSLMEEYKKDQAASIEVGLAPAAPGTPSASPVVGTAGNETQAAAVGSAAPGFFLKVFNFFKNIF